MGGEADRRKIRKVQVSVLQSKTALKKGNTAENLT